MRTLLVLRHAHTEAVRPGRPDHDRRLGQAGYLRNAGVMLDRVLCSSATRAQQTLQVLGPDCPVEISDGVYNAGPGDVLHLIAEVPDEVSTLLVVGHSPGLPTLAFELADPQTSDPDALAVLDTRFPPCSLATLEVDAPWPALRPGRLVSVRLA